MGFNFKIEDGYLIVGRDIYEVNYKDYSGEELKLNKKQKEEVLQLMTKVLQQEKDVPNNLDQLVLDQNCIRQGEHIIKGLTEKEQDDFLHVTAVFDRNIALPPEMKLKKQEKKVEPEKKTEAPKQQSTLRSLFSKKKDVSELPKVPDGFRKKTIKGDGDCLFNSVGQHMGKDYKGVKSLRRQVAKELRDNAKDYEQFFGWKDEEDEKGNKWTWQQYYRDIRNPPEAKGESPCYKKGNLESRRGWGGHIELMALSKILKRPICYYDANPKVKAFSLVSGGEFDIEELKKDPNVIFLYFDGTAHYEALFPEEKRENWVKIDPSFQE